MTSPRSTACRRFPILVELFATTAEASVHAVRARITWIRAYCVPSIGVTLDPLELCAGITTEREGADRIRDVSEAGDSRAEPREFAVAD